MRAADPPWSELLSLLASILGSTGMQAAVGTKKQAGKLAPRKTQHGDADSHHCVDALRREHLYRLARRPDRRARHRSRTRARGDPRIPRRPATLCGGHPRHARARRPHRRQRGDEAALPGCPARHRRQRNRSARRSDAQPERNLRIAADESAGRSHGPSRRDVDAGGDRTGGPRDTGPLAGPRRLHRPAGEVRSSSAATSSSAAASAGPTSPAAASRRSPREFAATSSRSTTRPSSIRATDRRRKSATNDGRTRSSAKAE